MTNKHIWKKIVYLGLIAAFMWGFVLTPAVTISVYGEETEEETEDESEQEESVESNDQGEDTEEEDGEPDESEAENSGGFTIHSDKVEGDMDINEALLGKVNIKEGTIEGLTITKELETGDERDPLFIQVTSPGPVDLKELKTETLEGPPNFEGICGTDPVCLEGVTMEVDHQEVENIDLPDAQITTCYASECENLPDNNSVDEEDVQVKMQQMEDQQLTLEEIMEGLTEDREKLEDIEDLLEQAAEHYDKIQKEGQVEDLSTVIKEINETLADMNTEDNKDEGTKAVEAENSDNDDEKAETENHEDNDGHDADQSEEEESDDAQREEAKSETDTADNQLHDLTEKATDQYESFDDISEVFFSTLDEALIEISDLKETIQMKEDALEAIENEKAETEESEVKEQADHLNMLQKAAEDQKVSEADKDSTDANQEDDKQEKAEHVSQAEIEDDKAADESKGNDNDDVKQESETDQSKEYKLDDVKDDLDAFKEEFNTLQQHADDLKEVEDVLREEKATITDKLGELKTHLVDDVNDIDLDEQVLEKLPSPPKMKKENEPGDEEEAPNDSKDRQKEKSRDTKDESDRETNNDDQKTDSPENEEVESENKEDRNLNGEKGSLINDLLESIEGTSP